MAFSSKGIILLCTLAVQAKSSLRQDNEGLNLEQPCPFPYRPVGGRCLFFHSTAATQYTDMRNLCRSLGGELAQIDDANLHATIVEFIKEEGLTPGKFWIGANDLEKEGVWRWPDGSLVRMGTPSWGYLLEPAKQEPGAKSDTNQDCGCLIKSLFYFFHDCFCDENNSAICEYLSKPIRTVPSAQLQKMLFS